MVYVTGDLHGDIERFKNKQFRRIKRGDTLIICGDFGFLWDGSKAEKKHLKWIGKRKYNVLFVDGVHDNLNLIHEYPVKEWSNGQTREISGRLRYACRGSIFTIDKTKILTFGGGDVQDLNSDYHASTWWNLLMPTPEEIETAQVNLKKEKNTVDYIISHQSSRKTKKLLTMEEDEANVLDIFFDELREEVKYEGWFFGNYHLDKIIPPKEMTIFGRVVPLLDSFKASLAKKSKTK